MYRFKNESKDKQVVCLLLIHKFSAFPPRPQPLWLCLRYKTQPVADPSSCSLFLFSLRLELFKIEPERNESKIEY